MYRLWVLSVLVLYAAPAMSLELTPDQEVYGPEDDIVIAAHNEAAYTIGFAGDPPYVAHNLDTGETITFLSLPVAYELAPDESMDFHLRANDLTPGRYELVFHYTTPPWEDAYESAFFLVEAPGVAAPAASMGGLKTIYVGD